VLESETRTEDADPLEASVPVPNQTALVEQIKAELLARGIIPPNPTDNRTPFEIVSRLAWALRGQGARLIRKGPAQNGYTVERGPHAGERYSHDAISFPDGWVDCLASAGPPANENRPVWGWTDAVRDPSNPNTAEPFDPDAAAVVGMAPAPQAGATPQPAAVDNDAAKSLAHIAAMLQEMRSAQEADRALQQRILEAVEALRGDVNSTAKTLATLAGGGGLGNLADVFKR
jgi:hypothetical protein